MLNYFELAANVAVRKQDQRNYFLGAVGLRRDGTLVHAANGPCVHKHAHTHAEARLARKLDYGAIVFVVRVLRTSGLWAIAKPCAACKRALRAKRVSKVFYTTGHNTFDVMDLYT